MNQPVLITKEDYKKLVRRIDSLEKKVNATVVRKSTKVMRTVEPPYGSKAWWQLGEKQATKDIKAGNVYKLKSVDDLDKPLKELFP